MHRTLKLSKAVYVALEKAAQASGTTPEGWIVSRLADHGNGMSTPSDEQIAQANAGLEGFVVQEDLGYDRGGDNESIDATLAQDYQKRNGLHPIKKK